MSSHGVPDRYAVVLTHNRPDLLPGCVDAIAPQVDQVIVVDNASDPPTSPDWDADNVMIEHVPDQPPNLSALWNTQLEQIAEYEQKYGRSEWDVALLCDDVVVPGDWFPRTADAMRATGAAAASAHSYTPILDPYMLTALSNGPDRMCPWAFILPGERGLRADETLHWWYCDTDVDWQARRSGGTLIVPGPVAPNLRVGDFTNTVPGLAEQAGRDGQTFHAKWGMGG